MTSEIKVISQALVLLGAQPISSLTDGSSTAEVASLLFSPAYDALLTETRWHFATRTQRLSKKTTSSNKEYTNEFSLPADCLVVLEAPGDYEIYHGSLFSNQSDVTVLYVFRPELDRLPAYFAYALQLRLASVLAIPITDDRNKTITYNTLAQEQLIKARTTDAQSRPNLIIEDSPYTAIRH